MVVDVPEGDLRRQRYEAMKVAQHRDMSKHKLDELPWSTGLLDVWRDPEILSMSLTGGLCGVCCILCLPAKTFVDVQNGADVWKRYIDPKMDREEVGIKGAMGVKFSSPGQALCWNMIVMTAMPPVRCYWRWRLRRKYVVKGMLIGDIINVLFCYICATLQEAREVRVYQDELFTAMKRIDGARLPTTFLAPYGVPSRMPVYNKETAEAKAEAGLPGQVVMKSNAKS